jgi:outer membrane protein OmpA-like peptidoglycan-associated protein
MTNCTKWLATTALGFAIALPALAQDAQGCKDHPLFNRMKGYVLSTCEQSGFDASQFPVGPAVVQSDGSPARMVSVEGAKTTLQYYAQEGVIPASALQVMRNFQNAVKAAGGTVEGEYEHGPSDLSSIGGGHRATTLKMSRNGKEVWSLIRAENQGPYDIVIIEKEAMKQEIVAKDLLDKINKDGVVALYINFDTAKATIQPESMKIIDEVASMLKGAGNLTLEVGGHTDNIGAATANQTLSEARAKSVVAALIQRGIAASRLQAKGYGQTVPIADNRSEEGRAKNRRVELKKS